ncbi:MAG: TrkA family potassium uptake protein [Candidatus Hydrogenedentes bacterium]|nr:TrkA family potassium uptake protein [Candidatus Hydrogenedentota bacterium]
MRATSQYIVVVGCGRLGAYLANQLSQRGHSVVVIDVDRRSFRHLSAAFSGFKIEADGTEVAALRQAKAEKADLLLATTRRDNVNLMVAQVAKQALGVPRVIARVFDPEREESYRGLGVETVCSTVVAGDTFLGRLGGEEQP